MNRPVIHLHRMAGATRDPEMMAIYRRRDLRETRHVVIGPTVTWSGVHRCGVGGGYCLLRGDLGDWGDVVTTTKKTTAKPRARKAEKAITVEAIKGFNHDMTCLGFQFEIGKEYSVPGKVVPCKNGFHACPVDTVDPMRVFGFYPPGQSRYCIVDQGAEIVPHGDDKAASGTIFVRKEISIGEIIDRAVAYRLKNTKATGGTSNSAATTARPATAATTARPATAATPARRGQQQRRLAARPATAATAARPATAATTARPATAATTARPATAATTARPATAATTARPATAATTARPATAALAARPATAATTARPATAATRGAASNSGDYGAASNSGYYGAAFSHAYNGKVMCEGDGQALYITEFADDGSIASVACGITGRDGIKAGIWYVCKGGKLVPAEKSA
jgi:hypothetical protein